MPAAPHLETSLHYSPSQANHQNPNMEGEVVLHLTENPQHSPENKPDPPFPTKTQQEPEAHNARQKPPLPFSRARTLQRLSFSKPKSRFMEQRYYPNPSTPLISEGPHQQISNPSSPNRETKIPATLDDDEEEAFREDEGLPEFHRKRRKFRWRTIVEWTSFFIITTCLVCGILIRFLTHRTVWGLEMWKWCVMVLVLFCGRLFSGWLISLTVFFIERNFMLKNKVLYFVYGLRKSLQNCVWWSLVLLAWALLFHPEVHGSGKYRVLLGKITMLLISVHIGVLVWLVKILLVKVLASSFHVNTFFDRIHESIFHHYVLETLSGSPLDEISRSPAGNPVVLSFRKTAGEKGKGGWGSKRIDPDRLRMLSRENVSARSMKRLVNFIKEKGLSTISRAVDETMDDFRESESEINSELEARVAAQSIFENVAKPGQKFIEADDLLRFLKKDEVNTIFPLFEGAVETGKIRKSAFRNWVVRAYIERKSLAHSLNDTKTAVQQLHRLASCVVCMILFVMALLVTGVATTKVVVVITSQLLLVGFMFGNTCKIIFESIIFVFAVHPFDVGDRCVVDGVQMVVEEINILTTVFLRYDNEKVYYPNAVLITKPISNFYRSPDMGDTIEFSIDIATPVETITALKKCIQEYIESKSKHWHPKHSIVVKEIENVNKMTMLLCVTHTMNHQNYGEKNSRKSDLIFEMKKFFEKLGIKYHLLPQEVRLCYVPSATARIPMLPS